MVSPDYVELSVFAGSALPGVYRITASRPWFHKGKALNTDFALDGETHSARPARGPYSERFCPLRDRPFRPGGVTLATCQKKAQTPTQYLLPRPP